MNENTIQSYYNEFLKNYDPLAMDKIWADHSRKFREFWKNKILNGKPEELSELMIDEIVRILDRNGKGNRKGCEAVAKVMIPQGEWRRMFGELCENKELAKCVNDVFIASNAENQIIAIDHLYKINEGSKGRLTGPSGNAINTMMAAYDPVNNMTVISFAERMLLMQYFQLKQTFDPDKVSFGMKYILSNNTLLGGLRELGVKGSARTVSCFCYLPALKAEWKGEITVERGSKSVDVSVPVEDHSKDQLKTLVEGEARESIQIQGLLADIGLQMGMSVWIPRGDKVKVIKQLNQPSSTLIDELPLLYDKATMGTIEQIDVLWLQGRMIIRAFEVEHTTAIYSGILRMADLLALMPNINIKLHIVAPSERKKKVYQEIKRPVFSLWWKSSLAKMCTYLSYESIRKLVTNEHLRHLSPNVLDEIAESAE
jgi:hypothetical protein